MLPATTSPRSDATTAVYVHLPFCRIRCSYCAFAISTDLSAEARYVDALLREIDHRVPQESRLESIYFGGGTPSLTSPGQLARISSTLRSRCDTTELAEVTIEANPEDVTDASLASWAGLGITRISIGAQSLRDEELVPLGRGHGRRRALDALGIAVESGLDVCADLILGLPLQTRESFLVSLEGVLDTGVGHLSIYMLDLEEGSVLEKRIRQGWKTLPDEEIVAGLYLEAVERLTEAGFAQYEISNFGRPEKKSLHNLRYWRRAPYVGLGLGAQSFDGRFRSGNARALEVYLELVGRSGSGVDFTEEIDDERERHETLFLSLRQVRGLSSDEFLTLTGADGARWRDEGIHAGWVVDEPNRVALTPAGFLVSNELISQLF